MKIYPLVDDLILDTLNPRIDEMHALMTDTQKVLWTRIYPEGHDRGSIKSCKAAYGLLQRQLAMNLKNYEKKEKLLT